MVSKIATHACNQVKLYTCKNRQGLHRTGIRNATCNRYLQEELALIIVVRAMNAITLKQGNRLFLKDATVMA